MAKSKKPAAPSRNGARIDNHARTQKLRVKPGEPWHVEVVRIRAKTQTRMAIFFAVSLILLLAGCTVLAWMANDREQTKFLIQFITQGLSIVLGWTFGRNSKGE